jgi:MFS family permease
VGLVEFIPMTLFLLPAGEICDRGEPRRVLSAGLALQMLCACGFLTLTWLHITRLWPFYSILVLSGTGRAFAEPASQALLPLLVPLERLPHAIAWGSCVWQVAVIAGPALGGLAYAFGPTTAYTVCCSGFLAALLAVETVSGRRFAPGNRSTLGSQINRIREGMRFVRSRPILLGAISLDLVSVLLGGATALLPVYARDILQAGPIGLGLLRSAPAVGAGLIALHQVRRPPDRRIGLQLFAAVAAFGIATIIFALSTSLALALAALFVVGAADMLSVNIRSSLVQLTTPDALRGRVSAVHMLFVSTSSELGAFESGLLASLIGTVPCVVVGGIGVVIAAAIWVRLFPALRRADRITPAES